MNKLIIAIDGYSSCGKSTLAKRVAKELGYTYIDTGAMYRAVTLYALRNNLFTNNKLDEGQLINLLEEIEVSFYFNSELGRSETFLNGENIEQEIRGLDVSNRVSRIAKIKEVRAKLVKIQREIGKEKGLVMDGRDIGTVVFPDADIKIFMTADYKIRAQRRFKELQDNGDSSTFEEVLKNITSRDNDDTSRSENPLSKAEDAIVIDNSNMTKDETLKTALDHVSGKISR